MRRLYDAIKIRMSFCKQHDIVGTYIMALVSLILTYFVLSHLLKEQWFAVITVLAEGFILLLWLYYGVVLEAFRKHYGEDFPK